MAEASRTCCYHPLPELGLIKSRVDGWYSHASLLSSEGFMLWSWSVEESEIVQLIREGLNTLLCQSRYVVERRFLWRVDWFRKWRWVKSLRIRPLVGCSCQSSFGLSSSRLAEESTAVMISVAPKLYY